MLEQKARMPMDHMRGMTSEQVAQATLRAIARGKKETTLTFQGKLILFVSRFFPRIADRFARKTVRRLFAEEIAARQQRGVSPFTSPTAPAPAPSHR
jgi:short-subunit dehydrogenase